MKHGKCIVLPDHTGASEVDIDMAFMQFELIMFGCVSGFLN